VDGSRDSQVLTLEADDNVFEEPVVGVVNNQITLDSLESSEAEEICPICHEGRIEEIGGCSTCTNCKVQLKCGL